MCFSAQADVVSGVVVTGIGVDTLRQIRQPAERALASLPVLLGTHLLVEAVVWWGLAGDVAPATGRLATQAYLGFALCVLPVLVPSAVRAAEPEGRRRQAMLALGVIGAALAVVYLAQLVHGPVDVRIEGHHLAYQLHLRHGGLLAATYGLVACAPSLLSSHRGVVRFGVANLAAVVALAWLQSSALTSLWCAWAAVTSLAIAAHLRHEHRADWPLRSSVPLRSSLDAPRSG